MFDRFSTREAKIDEVELTIPSNIRAFLTDYNTSHFIACNESRATYYNLKYMKSETPEEIQ